MLLKFLNWVAGLAGWSKRTSQQSESCPPAGEQDSIHPGAGFHTIRIRSPFTKGDKTREVRIVGFRGLHIQVESVDHKQGTGNGQFVTLIMQCDVLPESMETFRNVRDFMRGKKRDGCRSS